VAIGKQNHLVLNFFGSVSSMRVVVDIKRVPSVAPDPIPVQVPEPIRKPDPDPEQAFVDRDCGDFDTQAEAQRFLDSAGTGDPHRLDRVNAAVASESLP